MFTYIQDQFSSFHTTCCGRVILKRLGQTVKGLKLLVILLVLYLKGTLRDHIISEMV